MQKTLHLNFKHKVTEMKKIALILLVALIAACSPKNNNQEKLTGETLKEIKQLTLTIEQANHLSKLPLKCMQQEYPNKLSQTLGSEKDIDTPKTLHPAFYGCFDWHSSVHGHWMLVKLLKLFPGLENKDEVINKLAQNITAENILVEVGYFKRETEKSYERTYGWAWLLKLAEELHTWDSDFAKELETNLQPLTDLIVGRYLDFLPRLNYPIRVGEHTNTGFGLAFAWDYANTVGNMELKSLIEQRAKDFYLGDIGCPLSWEPGGYDFLSPCLEEADIMRRVLPKEDFRDWLAEFLPQLSSPDFSWEQGKVSDRSDGKLVHLDGVNFSRAWCLYGIASTLEEYAHLKQVANEHIQFSLPNIVDGDYMGEHWLASFAIYALDMASS